MIASPLSITYRTSKLTWHLMQESIAMLGLESEYIVNLNIARYKKLLFGERDEAKRCVIIRLLAEEEIKLADLLKASGPKPATSPFRSITEIQVGISSSDMSR